MKTKHFSLGKVKSIHRIAPCSTLFSNRTARVDEIHVRMSSDDHQSFNLYLDRKGAKLLVKQLTRNLKLYKPSSRITKTTFYGEYKDVKSKL